MSKSRSSKARLVITAITLENRTVAEVVADYGVSKSWVYELLARHRDEGDAACEPRSRRPHTSPNATPAATVELILEVRKDLLDRGLDAGPDTIGWHLHHHHQVTVSRATIARILTRAGAVRPDPSKRPKSSYLRFEAAMPNETWQSDFTHFRLTTPHGRPGQDVEIISWLDDHSRYALHVSAHRPVTARTVLETFRQAADLHGYPASTLTDNGMVYTVRLAGHGRQGGKWLRVVGVAVGAVVLLWGNDVSLSRLWWSLALVLVLLGCLQVLVGAARPARRRDSLIPDPATT